MNILEKCNLCPRNCLIDRTKNKGICGCSDKMVIARASLHMWEEPCISGENGSGTIFFSGCNLKCIFCQNYEISKKIVGKEVSIEEFATICLNLEKKGANNINLVTPTPYVPLIIEGIKLAKKKGLKTPIVYNTSSYENIETIKMLDGIIDIYLPDLKYFDSKYAINYSNAPNYFEYAKEAIKEMYKQVGKPIFNEDGIMQKGMIIRHLVLPNNILNSRKVLKWINDNLNDTYVSVMAQYFPAYKAKEIEDINRKLTKEEYDEIEKYLYNRLNLENGYIQELGEHEEEYVPKWEY